MDPHDPNMIRVTTPTGSSYFGGSAYGPGGMSYGSASGQSMNAYGHIASGQSMASLHAAANQQSAKSRAPVEFNHAINYVNKIKNRFSTEPDTYKQFLEILRTYQQEQRPIQDVYAQVTGLFKGAPDLLDEFQQFLPDTSGNAPGGLFDLGGMVSRPPAAGAMSNGANIGSRLPPVGSFAPPPSADDPYRKIGGGAGVSSKKKRAQVNDAKAAKSKRSKLHHKEMSPPMAARDGLVPALQPAASSEELAFFDRVKKFISNKQTYNEFLKIINLFTQDIIDHNILVERVENFIGANGELFDWFKKFVGYDGKDQVIENIPSASTRPRLDLNSCKAYGNSYRLLPREEQNLHCAGRDDLCREVLNDEWASHPTWASEDSGFVAHKKNIHEEALGKCEEERYEYDHNIEANQRTIELLEPIAQRIAGMTAEEKARFRLEPGLGGRSVSIYQRVIKKIYDKEHGLEVIDAIHNNPSVAVPIVLKRCKAKHEEWRKAQREWNKVWREIEAKNYYKALDHQGTSFKANDKKQIATKSLVTEIETLRKEGTERNIGSNSKVTATSKTRYQFEFTFDNEETFKDAVRMVLSYLDKSAGHTSHDSEKMEKLLRTFLPLVFDLDPEKFKADPVPAGEDDAGDEDVDMSDDDATAAPKAAARDLRKDVLKQNAEKRDNGDTTIVKAEPNDETSPSSPAPSVKSNGVEDPSTWIQMTGTDGAADAVATPVPAKGVDEKRQSFNFFANNAFYCFFRLFQLIYTRLRTMKTVGEELQKSPERNKAQNQIALELGVQINRLDELEVGQSKTSPYEQVIELCDKLFDSDIDQTTFEESVRYLYGTQAYMMFTIDKVAQAMLKQAQIIVTDTKSEELMSLFEKDRSLERTTVRQQIIYRMQAESVLEKDENLYRLEWIPAKHVLTMQVLNKDDLTLDDAISSEEKWSYYIDSYVLLAPTEGVSSDTRTPFLRRNLPEDAEESLPPRDVLTHSGLEIKICINTYKIFFVNNTEDLFYRKSKRTSTGGDRRRQKWLKWLESDEGWKRSAATEDEDVEMKEDETSQFKEMEEKVLEWFAQGGSRKQKLERNGQSVEVWMTTSESSKDVKMSEG